jgi:hypothetical protein
MRLQDQVWPGPTGEILGGHYVYAVGYTPDYLLCCNSWGRGAGMGGVIKVARAAVCDSTVCSDRYLVTFAEPAEPVGE